MRPSEHCLAARSLVILSTLAAPGCLIDTVPPDIYASRPRDAAVAAVTSDAGSNPGPDAGPSTPAPPADGGPSSPSDSGPSAPDPQADAAVGACDLRGHWLITQRTVAQGLGVRQRAAWWFYYEIEQNGSDLTVKRGLVCGDEVYPLDLLAAAVEFNAAFPEIVKKNSNAGRRGKAIANGSSCAVSFEKSYDIVGATTPHYKDPSVPLPTLDQQASGSTPGWEDWDADGQPAVTLHVSGIANGERYTVLRVFAEWSGTIAAGATNFKIPVTDWGQEESVLGVTSDLLSLTGSPDADPSGHFTQFAKLMPDQVKADDIAMCDAVRMLAPTLTAEANQ